MKNSFYTYHPAIPFFYFTGVLAFCMFVLHPVFLAVSGLSAFAYLVLLKGPKSAFVRLLIFLPMALLIAVGNPLFNHEGATILWYLKSQNPVTLESILFGAASGGMFLCVLLWFSCYHEVMTSDKFIYLFGRVIPATSLILSMVLRFVPRYRAKFYQMRQGQRGLGRDLGQGSLLSRLKNGLRILSMMTTWALESAVDTADSMNSRGYGLPRRTSFSIYRFDRRDRNMASALSILYAAAVYGVVFRWVSVRYFPTVRLSAPSLGGALCMAAYLLFCLLPVGAGLWEEIVWRRTRSKI